MTDQSCAVEVFRPRRHRPKPPPPALPLDSLCTAAEAAALRRVSLATWWLHVKRGLVPPPVYVGPRSPRWRVREVIAAPAAAPVAAAAE